jgi:hypothetical protein
LYVAVCGFKRLAVDGNNPTADVLSCILAHNSEQMNNTEATPPAAIVRTGMLELAERPPQYFFIILFFPPG